MPSSTSESGWATISNVFLILTLESVNHTESKNRSITCVYFTSIFIICGRVLDTCEVVEDVELV